MGEGFTPRDRAERKPVQESTPQESGVFERYVDLRLKAYDALMNDEERKDFDRELIDVVRILNEGAGIDSSVREELLRQIHTIEQDYLRIKKAAEAVKELERANHEGHLVPDMYKESVNLIREALDAGVPNSSLEPLKDTVETYLRRVERLQSSQ